MIQNEKQLKKIIKETLLLSEVGQQLDNVISGFEKEFKQSGSLGNSEYAIRAIRKNNTLLELILELVYLSSRENFEEFYKNSNLIPKENENIEQFWEKQKKCRIDDKTYLEKIINDFIKEIKDKVKTNSAKAFLDKLSKLKSDLNDYIPKWHVLQYLFFHIDDEGFGKVLNEFCAKDENFITPIDGMKGFQIPGQNTIKETLLQAVKKSINDNGLTEDDKRQILSETVESEEFQSGIERGEWGWLTGAIDSAVSFFFPDIRSVSNEVEGFFKNFETAVGGQKNVKKVMDKLTKNVTIKSLLKKMGAGDISEKDITEASEIINNMAALVPGLNNRVGRTDGGGDR